MNAATLRIVKEVRLIFWTWIAVVALALLALFASSRFPILNFAGGIAFFVGVPLLAVIPIGSELEDGTLALLLSQPITRIQVWLQKFAVSAVAAVTASFAFALVWRSEIFTPFRVFAVLWVVASVCAGPYCALLARTVRGGLALNLFSFALVLIPSQLSLWLKPEMILAVWAVLMLALGIRKMARFELTNGYVGGDLLTVAPRLRLFRIRPAGAVTNFIRKELGLLRPLWLITFSFLIIWTGLTIWHRPVSYATSSNVVVAAIYETLSILLAGSLSVGEEKLSGMHPWHLSLPMSSFRQWLLKLVTALLSSILCAVVVPYFLAVVFQLDVPSNVFPFAVTVAVLTCAVFWSACFVKGTVRAIILSVAVLVMLGFARSIGAALGEPRGPAYFYGPGGLAQFILPVLALGLIQSYRMFRVQPPQTLASFLRYLLPLAITAFVFSVL
jgi:hypothetical protein